MDNNNFKSSVFQDTESLARSAKIAADDFKKNYGKQFENEDQFEEMRAILAVRNSIFDDPDISKNFKAATPTSVKFTPVSRKRDNDSFKELEEIAEEHNWIIDEVSISHEDYEKFMRIQYCINLFKGIHTETEMESIKMDSLGALALAQLKKYLPNADEAKLKVASNVLQQAFCKELDDYCGWLNRVSNFRVTAPFEKIESTSDKVTIRFVYAVPEPALLPKQEEELKSKYKSQSYTVKETKLNADIRSYTYLCADKNDNWIVELNPGKADWYRKKEPATLSLLTKKHRARQSLIGMDVNGKVTTKIKLAPTLTFGSDTSATTNASSSTVPSSPTSSERTFYSVNSSSRNSSKTDPSSIDSTSAVSTHSATFDSANVQSSSVLSEKNLALLIANAPSSSPVPSSPTSSERTSDSVNSSSRRISSETDPSSVDSTSVVSTHSATFDSANAQSSSVLSEKELAFLYARGKAKKVVSSSTPIETTMSLERYTEIQGPKVFEDKEKNRAYILNYRRQPDDLPKGLIQPVFIAVPSELVAGAGMNQSINIKMRKDKSLEVTILANTRENNRPDVDALLKKPTVARTRGH